SSAAPCTSVRASAQSFCSSRSSTGVTSLSTNDSAVSPMSRCSSVSVSRVTMPSTVASSISQLPPLAVVTGAVIFLTPQLHNSQRPMNSQRPTDQNSQDKNRTRKEKKQGVPVRQFRFLRWAFWKLGLGRSLGLAELGVVEFGLVESTRLKYPRSSHA